MKIEIFPAKIGDCFLISYGNNYEKHILMNLLTKEELLMLENLNLENTFFFGLHASNVIPIYGFLGEKKQDMIADLKKGLASLKDSYLNKKPLKDSEGRVVGAH